MIGKYQRGGVGVVLCKLDTVYKMKSGIKGLDGQELVLGDPDFNQQQNARTHGEVIQIPIALSKAPLYSYSPRFPAYGATRFPDADVDKIGDVFYSHPHNEYKFQNDIIPEVQVGDRIYFPWTVTHDKRNLIAKSPDNKSFIFRVSYDLVYAVARGEQIIPIGGNVLIDPIWESFESILKPTYYPFKDAHGQPMQRPKSEWIQVKTAPRTIDREGIVRHVGTPLKGEKCALKPGMKVLYKPVLKNVQQIEGSNYFVVPQNQILCYRED